MAVQVGDQDFEAEVMRSEQPVLVDLYADWCQPCKQLEPILRELENEYSGKIKFVRIDVDRSPRISQAFRVQSIPMLVLLNEGRPVDQLMGLNDKKTIAAMLQPWLPKAADEVQPPELQVLLQAGRAVAVDVREPNAFARYRIPGAINVPADQLATRASELRPSDGRVRVLYGRSGDEGRDLAAKVRETGVQVAFLSGGFLHWESARLPVERGA